MEPLKLYINERDAAEHIGLSVKTLQRMRREGGGPKFFRISSRCVRYSYETLDAFMKEREFENTQQYKL